MKTYVASMASVAPYFQSRKYELEVGKLPKESNDEYEKRTWMYRTHVNEDGQIVIPAAQFQFSLQGGAKYLNERIPERNRETWTKHFMAGIMVPDGIVLPERRETIQGLWLAMNPLGRRGGGTRVMRRMPFVNRWAGDLTIHVLDDLITRDILKRVIEHAGMFEGIGQNRPGMGGQRGRFTLTELVEIPETVSKVA
jgi:hypothetical protein